MKPIKIFISYSHQDENYKDRLIVHMSSLKRRGIVKEWHDRKLIPGQKWDGVIKKELLDSDIILLLISADFLASNYCFDVEINKAMERHEQGEAIIIPIILKPCDWKDLPFRNIQGLPIDAKPLSTWTNIDEGYLNIIEGIKANITQFNVGIIHKPFSPCLEADLKFDSIIKSNKRNNNENISESLEGTQAIVINEYPIILWSWNWKFNLTIYNNSKYAAYDLKIESIVTEHFTQLENIPKYSNLPPFAKLALKAEYEDSIEGSYADNSNDKKSIYPKKFQNLKLKLTFRNEENINYTKHIEFLENEIISRK